LPLIVLVGAAFRFYGLRWEDALRNYPHPDERHLANTMARISLPPVNEWAQLCDPDHSPLNPRRLIPGSQDEHYDLAYGTLPVYLYRAVAVLLARLLGQPDFDSYYAYGAIGRTITVFFALLTLIWTYALGKRIYGTPTGLLAAGLLATCVLHIQMSHFMTVDLLMSAMLTAGLLLAVRFAHHARTIDALWMGVLLGLSMACKFNGITLGAGLAAAYVLAWLGGKRRLLDLAAYCAPLTVLGWAVAFGAFEYYALRDPYTYAHAIGIQADMVTGRTDWPYTRQFVNTAPYLFQLHNLVQWGMGWPLGVAALAGAVVLVGESTWQLVRPVGARLPIARTSLPPRPIQKTVSLRITGTLVLLGWSLPFFLYTARLEVKFLRYMLPLAAVLCLFAADLTWRTAQWFDGARRRAQGAPSGRERFARWIMPTLILLPTLLWATAYARVYAQEHPWQAASRWFYEHAPRGSAYTWEAWGDPLPTDLPAEGLYRRRFGYRDVRMHIYQDMPPEGKLQHIADSLREADYVVLSTPRIYLSVSRLPWRYPIEIRYYELLFTEQLGYRLVNKFTAPPGIGPLSVDDIDADQSFYDYDHPPVLIFAKARDLSDAEWRELFSAQLKATPRATRWGDTPPVQLPIP